MAKKVELCDTAKDGGIGGTSAPYSERKTKNGKKCSYSWALPFKNMMDIEQVKEMYFNDKKLVEVKE